MIQCPKCDSGNLEISGYFTDYYECDNMDCDYTCYDDELILD